ncbi:hypothetical protein [Lentibacillus sp. CBA3610]|uniref:hypothetical protein n=1 Tax=Lentibacillus sp. CBA3610 TaxID=2518176 RepID=UPI001595A486|nr:hypothetical protein [Lentibacillus sp. CBA3610]QKY70256.1 hypothetical protein Len3610_12190 [Lentibacillus sp. CBA3610]
MSQKQQSFFDIWGDNVNLKDLLIAMAICIVTTLGGFIVAPGDDPQPLIFGLVGGVLGFIISTIIIKPKRVIEDMEEES